MRREVLDTSRFLCLRERAAPRLADLQVRNARRGKRTSQVVKASFPPKVQGG